MDKNTLTRGEGEQMLERLRQTRPVETGGNIDPPPGLSPEHDAAIEAVDALVATLRG
jgi:hypothetical protein